MSKAEFKVSSSSQTNDATIVISDLKSNSVNLKVGSSPTNTSIETTGSEKKAECGHTKIQNPHLVNISKDSTIQEDVKNSSSLATVQNDDVINISSGDEGMSESEDENDLTLSLSESNENSMDNSMELSQVF